MQILFCRENLQKLAIKGGKAEIGRFSDGEISVKINENVRGKDVFIVQPTCYPSHVNLIELILMVDALRWSSAGRITAVIPYYGYARQDRRVRSKSSYKCKSYSWDSRKIRNR